MSAVLAGLGVLFIFLIWAATIVFTIWFGFSLLIHVQADQGLWNLWIVAVILQFITGGVSVVKLK